MNEPWEHYAQWNKPATKKTNTVWFYLYEVLRRVKIIKTKCNDGCLPGAGGSYCLIGTEFQFYKMKKVTGVDGGDGCTMWMYLMLQNCKLKNG